MRKALAFLSTAIASSNGDVDAYSSKVCVADLILLQTAQRRVSRRPSCPPEVNSLSAASIPHDSEQTTFARVIMADYPSTGSSWLEQLLVAAASAEKVGNPACSIYPEGSCRLSTEVHCECDGFANTQNAGLIKSHYPSQELYHDESIDSEQYHATMKFDRIVQLVRHPIASIKSNCDRWGGSQHTQSHNLHCWGAWWERVKETAGDAKVLVVRYEDLCLDTAAKVYEVLQFLGGSFASITRDSANKTVAARPDLDCTHKNHLDLQTRVTPETKFIVEDNKHLMARWGYRTDEISEWNEPSEVSSLTEADKDLALNLRNPWSEVWQAVKVE